ncbi:hypothetical protein LCGC14_2260530 [marine sediment metagenome]|uniref:Uncharacterized protein n=1 Tax=marine sediment metagenome TaxID=412755 RepID=A0A0F9DM81_9ZZZZ
MVRAKPEVPTMKADELQLVVKMVARRLHERLKGAKKSFGPKPFLGEELSEDELFDRYNQVRHDVEGWTELLPTVSKVNENGAVLLRKDFVEQVKAFERRNREGI